ncbi:DUF2163 domain-containing protein [Erythrobacter sp. W53]|uniref:DUF2163 domain-containing protein n=1 Tax=Erythrobacter sp. W53 TaxID=3425947 RepID=UPI003D7687D9
MSRTFFDRPLDTVATFWQVLRRDGVTLGFTAHDRDIWFGGILHRAAPGMLPSAIRKTASLQDDPADVDGALAHDSISAEDLASGRYDLARIAIGLVDWESGENAVLYRGQIGSVSRENGQFSAELQSAKIELDVDTIPRTSPTCRARFCDRGCTLSHTRFTHRATITDIDFDANSLGFTGLQLSNFVDGELRFIDGPQAGFLLGIIGTQNGMLTVDGPLDTELIAGAQVSLREGCDHTIATCTARFDNAANFQGEPFLPGNDLLVQYPVPR